jgi:hypothetical protein
MTRDEAIDLVCGDQLIFWDDCDAALVGIGGRCSQESVAVYDYRLLVQVFVDQGMDDEEAEEWISYNVEGAWVGPLTPIILRTAPSAADAATEPGTPPR